MFDFLGTFFFLIDKYMKNNIQILVMILNLLNTFVFIIETMIPN